MIDHRLVQSLPLDRRALLAWIMTAALAAATAAGLPATALGSEKNEAAEAFVQKLTDAAIRELTDSSQGRELREQRFQELFNESFDMEAIGRFVLGRYWRSASEAERAAFLNTYDDVVARRFVPLFNEYSGESLRVERVSHSDSTPELYIVHSRLLRPDAEGVRIDWKLLDREGHFKVVDLVVEGVSMAISQRSEYAALIERAGGHVGALTDQLQEQLARNQIRNWDESGG
jgi:phospholipid transport system substrate-binding protein